MNLWVKRVGQLAVVSVALFFFSCQDESSLLGFKNPSSKFELGYVDIPVGSSVLLFDSIRTSNFNATNDLNRFLVGNYVDPVFGKTTSAAFGQFVPVSKLTTDTTVTLVYDSASLRLRFDYYIYGAPGNTNQIFNIHTLSESLPISNVINYSSNIGGQHNPTNFTLSGQKLFYSNQTTSYSALVGTKKVGIDFDSFISWSQNKDKSDYINIALDFDFGKEIFEVARKADSIYTRPDLFTNKFYGLAIVPDPSSDKVVGFYPKDNLTRLRLHYHTVVNKTGLNKDTLALEFTLDRVSYNKIITDRTGSELAGLTTPYQEYAPTDSRYIQAGTGVVTKLDLSKFIEFTQSDTISRLAINSAELVIKNPDAAGQFSLPQTLAVRILKENNRPKKLTFPGKSSAYQADLSRLSLFEGWINFDRTSTSSFYGTAFDSTFTIMNDRGNFLTLEYSSTDNRYAGTANLFFQQLFKLRNEETLLTNVVLIPYETATTANPLGRHNNGKTLNRVSFNKDNIVLRIHYTIPTVNQN